MQIVIDIPEDDYQRICETKLPSYGAITDIIHRAFKYIKNGKPLPKGHGRLIDADALENYIKEDADEWADEWDKYALAYVEGAPTIIDAHKE